MGSTLKSIVLIIILLGAIGVASYFTVKRTKPDEEQLGYTAILMCTNPRCKKVFEGKIIAGRPPPFRCKYCGKMSAYRAVRCQNCGEIFAKIEGGDQTSPDYEEGALECPECGYDKFDLVESMEEVRQSTSRTK